MAKSCLYLLLFDEEKKTFISDISKTNHSPAQSFNSPVSVAEVVADSGGHENGYKSHNHVVQRSDLWIVVDQRSEKVRKMIFCFFNFSFSKKLTSTMSLAVCLSSRA